MRPINADKMEQIIKGKATRLDWLYLTSTLNFIDEQPTLDVRPNIHASWDLFDNDWNTYKCSNCGELWTLNAGTPEENNMNYCPKCGAKMSGEEAELLEILQPTSIKTVGDICRLYESQGYVVETSVDFIPTEDGTMGTITIHRRKGEDNETN